jgi:hypothetical protein
MSLAFESDGSGNQRDEKQALKNDEVGCVEHKQIAHVAIMSGTGSDCY